LTFKNLTCPKDDGRKYCIVPISKALRNPSNRIIRSSICFHTHHVTSHVRKPLIKVEVERMHDICTSHPALFICGTRKGKTAMANARSASQSSHHLSVIAAMSETPRECTYSRNLDSLKTAEGVLARVGDIEEPVFILVLFVDATHQRSSRW